METDRHSCCHIVHVTVISQCLDNAWDSESFIGNPFSYSVLSMAHELVKFVTYDYGIVYVIVHDTVYDTDGHILNAQDVSI